MKINLFGAPLLILLFMTAAGGYYLGVSFTSDVICGDITYYNGDKKDLIKIRSCEESK